jgi:hypothetical protein
MAGEACPGGSRGPASTTSFRAISVVVDAGLHRPRRGWVAYVKTFGRLYPAEGPDFVQTPPFETFHDAESYAATLVPL